MVTTKTDDELRRLVNGVLMPGFVGLSTPTWLRRELADGLGGVCLFGVNVASREQVRRLTATMRSANPAVVISIDEEGGDVTRLDHLGGSATPTAAHLGRVDDPHLTFDVARAIGRDLRAAGINLNLAPVADVNSNPRNPVVGPRSFGTDPRLVARHVEAAIAGMRSAGVATAVKHFPGHGDTAVDSHLGLPVVTRSADALARRELVPFVAAIKAGTDAVMTSHILLPAIDPSGPATMSRVLLTDLLRGSLGFTGVVVTDALDMAGASGEAGIPEAAVRALAAGADLLCLGTRNTPDDLRLIREHILKAVSQGRLPLERISDAATRVRVLGAEIWDRQEVPGALLARRHDWAQERGFVVTRPILAVKKPVVVRLASTPNNAVGDVEWGIGDYLGDALGRCLRGTTCLDADPDRDVAAVLAIAQGRPLVVQARDICRVPSLADAVRRLREDRPDAIIVDEGWADLGPDASAHVDIATFGASAGMALRLAELLNRGTE